jgi:transcriptional regulator with XRE-family HTH domain
VSIRSDDLDGLTTGQRIQILRERKGLTRPVLAGLVGMSASWLKSIERGILQPPRLPMLVQLGEVLGIGDVAVLAGTDMSIGDASVPVAPAGGDPPMPGSGHGAGSGRAPQALSSHSGSQCPSARALAIGVLISDLRSAAGWSQSRLAAELAAVSGRDTVTREDISRWEKGRRMPGPYWLRYLAASLQVPLTTLEEAGRMERHAFTDMADIVAALRALSARVDTLTEALDDAAGYRVPGASGRRAPLYLVRPPDEAG